jgi:hypothetical protein
MAVLHEASGDVVQHLTNVFAEVPHQLAAVRTGALRLMDHILPWQMLS